MNPEFLNNIYRKNYLPFKYQGILEDSEDFLRETSPVTGETRGTGFEYSDIDFMRGVNPITGNTRGVDGVTAAQNASATGATGATGVQEMKYGAANTGTEVSEDSLLSMLEQASLQDLISNVDPEVAAQLIEEYTKKAKQLNQAMTFFQPRTFDLDRRLMDMGVTFGMSEKGENKGQKAGNVLASISALAGTAGAGYLSTRVEGAMEQGFEDFKADLIKAATKNIVPGTMQTPDEPVGTGVTAPTTPQPNIKNGERVGPLTIEKEENEKGFPEPGQSPSRYQGKTLGEIFGINVSDDSQMGQNPGDQVEEAETDDDDQEGFLDGIPFDLLSSNMFDTNTTAGAAFKTGRILGLQPGDELTDDQERKLKRAKAIGGSAGVLSTIIQGTKDATAGAGFGNQYVQGINEANENYDALNMGFGAELGRPSFQDYGFSGTSAQQFLGLDGGVIESQGGVFTSRHNPVIVPSNEITMTNVPGRILGVGLDDNNQLTGEKIIMEPGTPLVKFQNSKKVLELPLYTQGGVNMAMNFYKSGGKHKTQKSLDKWTKQKWTTASGKKSSETGEVYAPKKTIESLKSTPSGRRKLAAANRKKKEATSKGKQHARHGLHKGKRRNAMDGGMFGVNPFDAMRDSIQQTLDEETQNKLRQELANFTENNFGSFLNQRSLKKDYETKMDIKIMKIN